MQDAAGLGRNDLEMENLVAVRQRREIVVDLEILAGSGEGDDAGRRVDGKEAARVAAGGERVRDMAAADIVVVGDDGRHGDRGRGAGLVLVEGDLVPATTVGVGGSVLAATNGLMVTLICCWKERLQHTAALVADLIKIGTTVCAVTSGSPPAPTVIWPLLGLIVNWLPW